MRFLLDAHLPRRLVKRFREAGFEAIHTLDLPRGNRTTDTEINALSIQQQHVVVPKDTDFVNSFHLRQEPYKLLLISTGNIGNPELEALLFANIARISEGSPSSILSS